MTGGWSVYYAVNNRLGVAGRDCFGSRNMHLGLHLGVTWSSEEFEDSALRKDHHKDKRNGFDAKPYRFVKCYNLMAQCDRRSSE